MVSFCLKNNGMGAESFQILQKTANRIFSRREIELTDRNPQVTLTVTLDSSLQNDRYLIAPASDGFSLSAGNDVTLHAAFGRWLLEATFDGKGGYLAPRNLPIDFTPAKPLRGMYFATHFHNFYHEAPLEEVYEVIDDLALRGCNSLLVWFDMHHYNSMEDPEAQELVQRLRAILSYANRIGMGGSLTMLSNEAFKNSPEEMRAEWWPQNGYHTELDGHYKMEICPNKEGGIEKILEYRRQMLEYFKDLKIDYVVYWPYDQGGCTCEKCAPWGAKGYLKLFPYFKALIREMMPNTEIILSTWYFDGFTTGEWEAFYPHLSDGSLKDVPYIMSFFFNGEVPECIKKNGIPEGVKFIDFPEISMYSCRPWGGFGASVLTEFLDKTNAVCSPLYQGGFPYSEGVFEDANKFIQLASYSGLYPHAHDALKAYIKYEFCCDDDELYQAILKTETALARSIPKAPDHISQIENTADIQFVYDTLEKYNNLLPASVTSSRSFRLFYLRAVMDFELMNHGFCHLNSEKCKAVAEEIYRIYHYVPGTSRALKLLF